jgi:RecA-family ATPase
MRWRLPRALNAIRPGEGTPGRINPSTNYTSEHNLLMTDTENKPQTTDDLWAENVSEFPKEKAVSPQLRAALEHAAEGFRVFPLAPGTKDQPIGRWLKMATTNPEQIKAWWRENPNYNIAIDTTDLFVIDIDVLKGGAETWLVHELFEEIPETREAETRHGGRHLIFKLPPDTPPISGSSKTANKVFGQGIDLRSHHNYIVAPGSVVAVAPGATGPGCYRWRNKLTLAAPPQWALDLCNKVRPKAANAGQWVVEPDTDWAIQRFDEYMRDEAPEAFEGENRHATSLTPIHAGYDYGCSAETIIERMLTWNAEKCHPPLTSEHIERNVRTLPAGRGSPMGCKHPENASGFEVVEIEAPKGDAPKQEKKPKLPFINFRDWDRVPVPPQEWAVDDCVPLYTAGLFSGPGGAGKSTLGLQRSAAHVLDRDWIGLTVRQGPAIFFDAEDDVKVLHRRLAKIAFYYGVNFETLFDAGLHLLSYADRDDKMLAVPDSNRIIRPTKTFELLEEAVLDLKPAAVIINSSADVFAGNEIARLEVNQFVSMLRRLAIQAETSITLGTHPSRAGIQSGSGESGSTHWHNASRHRMTLWDARQKDDETDDGVRKLTFKKNQHGPTKKDITLRWQNGLFLPLHQSLDDAVAAAELAGGVFLRLLERYTEQQRDVSPNPGKTYAPSLFAKEEDAKVHRLKSEAFTDAMNTLFTSGKIHVVSEGPPSRARKRLRLGPGGAK